MVRSSKRILTTHVGSLIRPPDLMDLMRARQRGELVSDERLNECLGGAIANVVQLQAETGIDYVSDGELDKTISWSRYVLLRLNGYEQRTVNDVGMPKSVVGKDRRDFAEFYKEYDASLELGPGMRGWVVTGPISYKGQAAIRRDTGFFQAALKGIKVTGAFMCAVSPASVARMAGVEGVKLPAGKVLAPGTISHATNVVEHPELVAERIVRLAKLVGRENIIAGTDCGFAAQGPFVARVHPTIQWAKLRSLVEGARLATKQLWPRPAKSRPASRTAGAVRNAARSPARKLARRARRWAA